MGSINAPNSDTETGGHVASLPPSLQILSILRRSLAALHVDVREYVLGVDGGGERGEAVVSSVVSSLESTSGDTPVVSMTGDSCCGTLSITEEDSTSFWAAVASAQHDEYEKKCCFWLHLEEEGAVDDQDAGPRSLLCAPAA